MSKPNKHIIYRPYTLTIEASRSARKWVCEEAKQLGMSPGEFIQALLYREQLKRTYRNQTTEVQP